MANALYTLAKQSLLGKQIDLVNDTIKCLLVTSGYSQNLVTDQFLSTIVSGNRVVAGIALTSKTDTGGVFDADDVLFSALSGSAIAGVVLYQDTGTESTSRLLYYMDTVAGMPFTPIGADLTVRWSNSASKIFRLL